MNKFDSWYERPTLGNTDNNNNNKDNNWLATS